MIVWALVAVIVVLVGVVVWLLRPGPKRGGMIDLTPAAGRGELDLDWDDPRPVGTAAVPDGRWYELKA